MSAFSGYTEEVSKQLWLGGKQREETMSKVTDYKLVRMGTNNISGLEDTIKKLIAEGWQPVGDLKDVRVDVQHVFVQQMVKYDD